jgi:hypothetical protein
MQETYTRPEGALSYRVEPAPPGKKLLVRTARILGYFLVLGALTTAVVQIVYMTHRNRSQAVEYHKKASALHAAMATEALADPSDPFLHLESLPDASRKRIQKALGPPPKPHKGAIGRWRKAIHGFWAGVNIYRQPASLSEVRREDDIEEGTPPRQMEIYLHPNMPFTVMLLTPFTYLPVVWMAFAFAVIKVAAILLSFWMAAEIAAHHGRKIPDWVLGLGALWVLLFLVSDLQHANTNALVLLAVVTHLWLYRRGKDILAGGALTVAICLKMTPALFVIYWLYQRNWKLLGATVVWALVLVVALPALAVGPERYIVLTGSWLNNLIIPGLIEGAWYPIHINQSLPAMMSRFFLAEPHPGGNIFWNPDDNSYAGQNQFGWVAIASLSGQSVKWLIRLGQVAIVGLGAWAIGWRKLPRTDGRRLLHFGLVACGMMLLNQRTWDHHAGVLLLASVGVWHALGYAHITPARRVTCLVLAILAGMVHYLTGTEIFHNIAKLQGKSSAGARRFADVAEAYGPGFFNFLLLFAALVVLSVALKSKPDPFDASRQPILAPESGQ